MKRITLFLCFGLILLLSACSGNEEDTDEYYGFIGSGKVKGYMFTINQEREDGPVLWEIGYKKDRLEIERSEENIDELAAYATAISDGETAYSKVYSSFLYFLLVVGIALFMVAKHRSVFKNGGAIVLVVVGVIVLYFLVDASIDFYQTLQDVKFHYLRIVGVDK